MRIKKNNFFIDITCPKCRSILEVVKSDIQYTDVFGHGDRFEVVCGACDHKFLICDLLPKEIKQKIRLENYDNRDEPYG